MKKITILGSTGSIGINALSIIQKNPDLFKVIALVANKNFSIMLRQCELFSPDWVAMRDEKSAHILRKKLKHSKINTQVLTGEKDICALAALEETDHVISAIVGMAGLLPTLSAIHAGKTILLANKESLITSGYFFMKALSSSGAKIIPIDSEHNAIFQVLPLEIQKNLGKTTLEKNSIKHLVLTGSGGPFYKFSSSDLSNVTPDQACSHPNWLMGKKISVDSATMMNKGLEYAEARWLFNALESEIKILIHPESIIHSMVQYYDGSLLAQLSAPDIRTSISYAMSWPDRICTEVDYLNFYKINNLTFFEPDFTQFPCLKLAIDAFSQGQASMTVLNAANEIAVSSFLDSKISFTKIYEINMEILMSSCFSEPKCIQDILEIDRKVRILAKNKVSSLIF
ncbi:1-deoxy-D-xylulose-5-phosphate reductoisomerase [Buchnera aphidicola]|uniref:1-deoxy-D-xylulose 5-phosphate reductoisomerase n=2 Tax=Buchnera aphidicola TaxID=9 RepID=DXR_BUCA5|nr:1-deoxy-D-xylulose-5-phosphate reductoisomerase [Buchnera aphidicola]B8D7D6.1 RecName: Full=1-deoxy-D-xylulose 5-phosphate reductoisomerase; Short=DXP reductoisomerase; AltName: Full=1-deoxyxylulose-5-phosphate reductoisomerase; AltName: Full=2-C-methyl-D-erythritol 4-phosphate synthase [Buchnera aphidicola str. Tuc7 (Acyrthosiphon pisum)]B8D932.1 RecName: Full=1-deoxy-D-xylulose 5-phosphate reductoisomerase; Short=DXP reductoisomerase; AltName: Full=1-deoxyxylulose-5-phosphate reductoisomeras